MSNIIGPTMGYNEMINAFCSQMLERKAEEPSKYNPLRPSAAGKCAKQLAREYAEYKGLREYNPEIITPETHRIFSLGHSLEWDTIKHIREVFRESAETIQVSYTQQRLRFFELADGEWVEGATDGAFISKKYKALIDFKTKKDKFSAFHKTNWDETEAKLENMDTVEKFGDSAFYIEDLEKFLKEHNDYFTNMNFYQLNLYYFDRHKFFQEIGVDHCSLLYICKNDSRLREIRFKPSKSVAEYVERKYKNISEKVLSGKTEEVEKEQMLGSIACAFCRFNQECWPKENPLKAYFKTLPKKYWAKDLDRIPKDGTKIKNLFKEYEKALQSCKNADTLEAEICELLLKQSVKKVRLENQNIYEVRSLKSGGPGGSGRVVLRRSKN